jgi:uncharacterized protein
VIAYFDTSAVVPLIIDEPASTRAGELWDAAERTVCVRLLYPEARAALAQARRLGRLTAKQIRDAVRTLEGLLAQVDIVEIDEVLAATAGTLAETRGLRGYDAVHLAAAVRVRDEDLVLVAGDRALLDAATAEGLATATVS